MERRARFWGAVAFALLAAPASAESPATQPAQGSERAAAVQGLSAEDFGQRQQAAARLEELIRQQLKSRAAAQAAIDALQNELAAEIGDLGTVKDEEARQRAGELLTMESGLAAWTAQAMGAPADQRAALLAWGLSHDLAPVLAKAYGKEVAQRVAGIAALGKIPGPFADWTLLRLLGERESWVRAAAMAAVWDRPPTPATVELLWRRALPPDTSDNTEGADDPPSVKIDFPQHDAIEVAAVEDDSADQELALLVLRHMQSPLVEGRIKTLVAARMKKDEDNDPLPLHRLAESYKVKEAVPLLAREACGEKMREASFGNDGFGSARTSAIGAIATILQLDPEIFELTPAPDSDVAWKVEGRSDAPAVLKFYAWWRVHAKEYGARAPAHPPEVQVEKKKDPFANPEMGPPTPEELERQKAEESDQDVPELMQMDP